MKNLTKFSGLYTPYLGCGVYYTSNNRHFDVFYVFYQMHGRKSNQGSLLEEFDYKEYYDFLKIKTQKSRITFLFINTIRIQTESGTEISESKYQR